MVKWTSRSWRASMTDVSEYTATFYDPKKDMPYEATIHIYKRDSGITEYQIIIQGRHADPIRGWWRINTYFHKEGKTSSVKSVIDTANKAVAKLGSGFKNITSDEYHDWQDTHPIKKKRKNPSDWGIYGFAPDGTTGWLDLEYGSLIPRNAYASRWETEQDAKQMVTKLKRENKGWMFEVRRMGKVEYQ